jgi:hypothetical protein
VIDRKPAFAFVANRPHDLVVVARLQSSTPPVPKRIQLFYTQGGRPGSFDFDLNDPAYVQNHRRVGKAALKRILTEVKARSREKLRFLVWYFDDATRLAIESMAHDLAQEDATLLKPFEALVEAARLVSESEEVLAKESEESK